MAVRPEPGPGAAPGRLVRRGRPRGPSIYGLPLRLAAGAARRSTRRRPGSAHVGAAVALPWLAGLDRAAVHAHCVGLADAVPRRAGPAAGRLGDRRRCAGPARADRLAAAGVSAAGRAGAARLSFHLYNTDADVDRALARPGADRQRDGLRRRPGKTGTPGRVPTTPRQRAQRRVAARSAPPARRGAAPRSGAALQHRPPRGQRVGLGHHQQRGRRRRRRRPAAACAYAGCADTGRAPSCGQRALDRPRSSRCAAASSRARLAPLLGRRGTRRPASSTTARRARWPARPAARRPTLGPAAPVTPAPTGRSASCQHRRVGRAAGRHRGDQADPLGRQVQRDLRGGRARDAARPPRAPGASGDRPRGRRRRGAGGGRRRSGRSRATSASSAAACCGAGVHAAARTRSASAGSAAIAAAASAASARAASASAISGSGRRRAAGPASAHPPSAGRERAAARPAAGAGDPGPGAAGTALLHPRRRRTHGGSAAAADRRAARRTARGPDPAGASRRSSCQAAADVPARYPGGPTTRAACHGRTARPIAGATRCPRPAPSRPPGRPPGQLRGVLEPIVAAAGFELDAARRARRRPPAHRHGRGRLRRRASGLDDIARARRAASDELDRDEHLIGGSYTLEVTSPGVDRPLTGPRHWRRAHLRQVAVRTARRRARSPAGSGRPARRRSPCWSTASCASCATPTSRTPASQVEFRPAPEAEVELLRAARATEEEDGMNVDIAALRTIEREKDIPFETVIEAIETALLTAYRHTEGHQPHARIDIDRKTGVGAGAGPGARPPTARVDDRVGRHPGGLRPDRRHHRPPGDRAAAARRRARAHLRRVRGQGGRDRRRRRAARRPGQRPRRGDRRAVRADRGRAAAGRAGARRDATRTASGSAATSSA